MIYSSPVHPDMILLLGFCIGLATGLFIFSIIRYRYVSQIMEMEEKLHRLNVFARAKLDELNKYR